MAKRSVWRRIERWLVGIVMAVIAIVIERMVLRSLRRKGDKPAVDAKTITSRGGDVDLDGRS